MKIIRSEYFGIQRKMVASITSESWKNVPHAAFMYEPRVDKLFDEYKKLNEKRSPEDKITFNTVMLRVIVEGIKAAPEMNAHIRFDDRRLVGRVDIFENINISMTTILPNGEMMTTNLRDFQEKNIDQMSSYIKDLRERAAKSNLTEAMYRVSFNKTLETIKHGKLLQAGLRILCAKTGKYPVKHLKGKEKREYYKIPETERLGDKDLEQGTITVSNVGSLYLQQRGAVSLLEIIPPQVCVLGLGAVQEKPVVEEVDGKKQVGIGKILPICIAFDHRAIDMGETIPFIKKLDEIFENPEIIRQWVDEDKNTSAKTV